MRTREDYINDVYLCLNCGAELEDDGSPIQGICLQCVENESEHLGTENHDQFNIEFYEIHGRVFQVIVPPHVTGIAHATDLEELLNV